MSEDLTDYLKDVGIKVNYLHSEIKTLERIEIIRDLRPVNLMYWSVLTYYEKD